jgi:hypothetical protein
MSFGVGAINQTTFSSPQPRHSIHSPLGPAGCVISFIKARRIYDFRCCSRFRDVFRLQPHKRCVASFFLCRRRRLTIRKPVKFYPDNVISNQPKSTNDYHLASPERAEQANEGDTLTPTRQDIETKAKREEFASWSHFGEVSLEKRFFARTVNGKFL